MTNKQGYPILNYMLIKDDYELSAADIKIMQVINLYYEDNIKAETLCTVIREIVLSEEKKA